VSGIECSCGGGGDPASVIDIKIPKARRGHQCCECGDVIPTDIAAAWEVHRNMQERLFSVRQRYYREIQEAVQQRTNMTHLAAWPDVFGLLVPQDICQAALAAVRAMKEAT